jgi:hypothetical protein
MSYVYSFKIDNPVLKKKVDFFFSFAMHCNVRIGSSHELECETHYSLFTKLIYALENHVNDYVIKQYASHRLLNDGILEKFESWPKVKLIIKKVKGKKDICKNLRTFELGELKKFKLELETHELPIIIKDLCSLVLRPNSSSDHFESIKDLTCILISMFRNNNISVPKANEILRQISKGKIRDENGKGYATLEDIFNQFLKVFNTKYKSSFLYPIFNVNSSPSDLDFKLGIVRILSNEHPIVLDTFRLLKSRNSRFYEALNNKKPLLFALVEDLEYFDIEWAKRRSYEKSVEVQNILNRELHLNGFVSTEECLTIRKNKLISIHVKAKPPFPLNKNELNSLYEIPEYKLQSYPSSLRSEFYYKNSLFVAGYDTENIALLWQFLENMAPSADSKKLKELISNVVVKLYCKFLKGLNESDIHRNVTSLYSVGDNLGIPQEEQDEIYKDFEAFDLTDYKDKMSKHPFLKELVEFHERIETPDFIADCKKYIKEILIESNGYRNILMHRDQIESPFAQKLIPTFKDIVYLFREEIVRLIVNNNFRNYEEFENYLICNYSN